MRKKRSNKINSSTKKTMQDIREDFRKQLLKDIESCEKFGTNYWDDRIKQSEEDQRWKKKLNLQNQMRDMIEEEVIVLKDEDLIVIMELIKKYNEGGLKEVAKYASKSTEPTKEETR